MMIGYSIDGWWESYVALLVFVGYPLMILSTIGLAIVDAGRWFTEPSSGQRDVIAIALISVTSLGTAVAFSRFGMLIASISVVAVIECWTVLAALLDRHPTAHSHWQRQRIVLTRLGLVVFFTSVAPLPWVVAGGALGAAVGVVARLVTRRPARRLVTIGAGSAAITAVGSWLLTAASTSTSFLDFRPEPLYFALVGAVAALLLDVLPHNATTSPTPGLHQDA